MLLWVCNWSVLVVPCTRFAAKSTHPCRAFTCDCAPWQLREHLSVLTTMTPQTATRTATATTTRDGASATRFTRRTTTRESSKLNGGSKCFGKGRTAVMRRPTLEVIPQTRTLAYVRPPAIAPASSRSTPSADHHRPCIFQHLPSRRRSGVAWRWCWERWQCRSRWAGDEFQRPRLLRCSVLYQSWPDGDADARTYGAATLNPNAPRTELHYTPRRRDGVSFTGYF